MHGGRAHPPEPRERSEHLPQGERGDSEALRSPGTGGRCRAPESADNRLGELLPFGPSQSGLRGGGPTRDPAAAPMAVPHAQGEVRETRAILGREVVGRVPAHSPCSANGQLSVGEGMISSESPMREIRTLGSPSDDWKRSHGMRHRHRESRRQQLLPTSYRHRASRRLYMSTSKIFHIRQLRCMKRASGTTSARQRSSTRCSCGPLRSGADAQGIVDRLLRCFGTGRFAHVQRACVRPHGGRWQSRVAGLPGSGEA